MRKRKITLDVALVNRYSSDRRRGQFARLVDRWGISQEILPMIFASPAAEAGLGLFTQALVWLDDRRRPIAIAAGIRDLHSEGFAIQYAFVRRSARRQGVGRAILDAVDRAYEARVIAPIADEVACSWLRGCRWRIEKVHRSQGDLAVWIPRANR